MLLDIEGTTTRLAFVHDVLFPYARARLAAFLEAHGRTPEVAAIIDRLADEHQDEVFRGNAPPPLVMDGGRPSPESAVAFLSWLMDRDRKSPALKQLQGLIWERGYQAGELRGEVFPDVAPALRRWRAAGRDLAIYSSGSELAQRRLFESTPDGDLTPLISGFFDTRAGTKTDPASYTRIAAALGRAPGEILFLSDVTGELRAASDAGCQVALVSRPGNASQPDADAYAVVENFDEL
jgi:enolase-phosphatase E1